MPIDESSLKLTVFSKPHMTASLDLFGFDKGISLVIVAKDVMNGQKEWHKSLFPLEYEKPGDFFEARIITNNHE